MRVLLVHNRYRTIGGEERHVELLAESLEQVGCYVSTFEAESPSNPPALRRLALGLTLPYRPYGARLLERVMKKEHPDVVHFHNIYPMLTPAAIRAAYESGAATAATFHNYRFACPSGLLLRKGRLHEDCIDGSSLLCGLRNSRGSIAESVAYGIALEVQRRLRFFDRWLDVFVAPSHFLERMLIRVGYPSSRIRVIAHGIPSNSHPSPEGSYVFFAGRLSEEKGITTLLDSARQLPETPFVVAGDGPLASILRVNTPANLRYVGLISRDEVEVFRRAAALTVVPSWCYEVQPYGVLESYAVGKPVIASRLGALAELVIDGVTGLLVEPRSGSQLAAAIRCLTSNFSERRRMAAAALETAHASFDPLTQARLTVDAYLEAIGRRSRAVAKKDDWDPTCA